MKNGLLYLFCWILGVLLGYQGLIYFYPNLAYRIAKIKIDTPDNTFRFPELPDAESRAVVKPNPDFLYVTGFYDLSDGPLQVSGQLPDSTYWSVAMYRPNTVNFYVKNDLQFQTSNLHLVLAKEGEELAEEPSSEIVYSPTTKGLILFRILVTSRNPEVLQHYRHFQKSVSIKALDEQIR